jgi:MFS family permease
VTTGIPPDEAESASFAGNGDGPDRRRQAPSHPRRSGGAAVVIVLVLAVAGIGVGLAWAAVAPPVSMAMTQVGPVPVSELDAGRVVAMDAWYAVLGGGAGLLLGAVLATVFLRHGAAMVVALAVGACLAAALAYVAGSLAANGELVLRWGPDVPPETMLSAPLTLHAYGFLLVWPVAVLAPVVPLAWLGAPDDRDGYGSMNVSRPESGPSGPIGPEHPHAISRRSDIHRHSGRTGEDGPAVV